MPAGRSTDRIWLRPLRPTILEVDTCPSGPHESEAVDDRKATSPTWSGDRLATQTFESWRDHRFHMQRRLSDSMPELNALVSMDETEKDATESPKHDEAASAKVAKRSRLTTSVESPPTTSLPASEPGSSSTMRLAGPPEFQQPSSDPSKGQRTFPISEEAARSESQPNAALKPIGFGIQRRDGTEYPPGPSDLNPAKAVAESGTQSGGPNSARKSGEDISLQELVRCGVPWMASMHKLFGRNTHTLRSLVQEARSMRESDPGEFERIRDLLLDQKLSAEELRAPEIRNPLLELFVLLLRDVDHTKSHKPTKEELVSLCVDWKCPQKNHRCPLEAASGGTTQESSSHGEARDEAWNVQNQTCDCDKCSRLVSLGERKFCKECVCVLCERQLAGSNLPWGSNSALRCENVSKTCKRKALEGKSDETNPAEVPGRASPSTREGRESTEPLEGGREVCGHSAHAECALALGIAGVTSSSTTAKGKGILSTNQDLDGEYLCPVCRTKTLLLPFWRDRLLLASSSGDSEGVLRRQLQLAVEVMRGTKREELKPFQSRVEKAWMDLEAGCDPTAIVQLVVQIVADAESQMSIGPSLIQSSRRDPHHHSTVRKLSTLPQRPPSSTPSAHRPNKLMPQQHHQLQLKQPELRHPHPNPDAAPGPSRAFTPPPFTSQEPHPKATPSPTLSTKPEGSTSPLRAQTQPLLPLSGIHSQAFVGPGAATAASAMAAASAIAATLGGSLAGFQFAIANPAAMAAIAELAAGNRGNLQPGIEEGGRSQTLLAALGSDPGLASAVQSAIASDMASAPELMTLARAQQRSMESAQTEVSLLARRYESDAEALRRKTMEADALESALRRAREEVASLETAAASSKHAMEERRQGLTVAWAAERGRFEQVKRDVYGKGVQRVLARLCASVHHHLTLLAPSAAPRARDAAASSAGVPPLLLPTTPLSLPGLAADTTTGLSAGKGVSGAETLPSTAFGAAGSTSAGSDILSVSGGSAAATAGTGRTAAAGAAISGQQLLPPNSTTAAANAAQEPTAGFGHGVSTIPATRLVGTASALAGLITGAARAASWQLPAASATAASTMAAPDFLSYGRYQARAPAATRRDVSGREGSGGRSTVSANERAGKEAPDRPEGEGLGEEVTGPPSKRFKATGGAQGLEGGRPPSSPPSSGSWSASPSSSSHAPPPVAPSLAARLAAAESSVVRRHFPQHFQNVLNGRVRVSLLAAVARKFGNSTAGDSTTSAGSPGPAPAEHWRLALTRRKGKGFRLQLPTGGLDLLLLPPGDGGDSPLPPGRAEVELEDLVQAAVKLARESLGLGDTEVEIAPPPGFREPLRVSEEQKDGTLHMALLFPMVATERGGRAPAGKVSSGGDVVVPTQGKTGEGGFVSWCRADSLHPVVRDVPQKFSAAFPRVLRCLELFMGKRIEGWPVGELLNEGKVALDVLG